ncbi:unnamed protein product [Cladocopium goreaui]|uniref:Uncharacterized protein n=1 Tax=Cladocopium goreaui TaxID=2562237 RepID=A0A9P1FI76_9DINO|nr:unnamed protein product [Cladocopium goreaui]
MKLLVALLAIASGAKWSEGFREARSSGKLNITEERKAFDTQDARLGQTLRESLESLGRRERMAWADILKFVTEPKYVLGVRKWIWASVAAFLAATCFVGVAPILLAVVKRRRSTTFD